MSNEFDVELARLFAQAREPLTGGKFVADILARIERARRARFRRQVLVAALAAIFVSLHLPTLLEKAALLVHSTGDYSSLSAEFLITPLGWALSMLIGGWVLLRARWASR